MDALQEKEKVVELKPALYQIKADRPGGHVYLVKGSNRNVLIDTGMAAHYSVLKKALADVGLQPEDIHLIILTHEHFDHIGATAFFTGKPVIAAHRLAANKIQLQDEFVMFKKYLDAPAKPFFAEIWLESDMLFDFGNYRLRIIHTPGHSSGCICLYEPDQRLLFTGDTVLAGGVLSGIYTSGNISDYVNSIERLKELKVDEFYPGHGPISKNPAEDLEKADQDAKALLRDSKILFETLDTKASFIRAFAAVKKMS